MILYHGSNVIFKKFDLAKARISQDNYGGGVYLTDDKSAGMVYAKSMAKKFGEPLIYTVTANFKKTFDVDYEFTGKNLIQILPPDIERFARAANLLTFNTDKFEVLDSLKSGKMILTGDQIFKGLSSGMNNTTKAKDTLIKLGYDSIRYNGNLGKHHVYIAFNDNIKIEKIERLVKRINETKTIIQRKLDEDVSLIIRSCFGNEIAVSINNVKYTYIFDGNTDEVFQKVKNMNKYSSGKAIEYLKRRSMDVLRETNIHDDSANKLLKEVFHGI